MPKTKLKPNAIDESNLLTLEEAYRKLGKGFSPRSLRRKIASGEYKQGIHYFRSNGVNGIIKVNILAIKQNLIDINS
ncbi:hypothetical protein I8748_31835 [Nostoc sp. CENA67]|uniref:Uncharacterized protein n=1 Tax=Amazonocrinis nigriterrae CENA67 TaxID=2794033 RepID=A0A8J7HZX5_9NOST|nr:hypothetical protein [Amazonocrinis nigriterrae]MBH8566690.1 hypothetical protein [Amazonocrinis nigriterrae CENA67]